MTQVKTLEEYFVYWKRVKDGRWDMGLGKKEIILIFCLFLSISCRQKVTDISDDFLFNTPDGFRIYGTFSHPGSGKYCFVLLHGLGSTSAEWNDFTKKLKSTGYGYLAYDARGHGKSIHKTDNSNISYKNFFRTDWEEMIDDLKSAVSFLKKKGIKPDRTIIAGASLGANITLNYVVNNPRIPLIILLSPGIEYAGISTDTAIKDYGERPIIIAASPHDRYAYVSCEKLISLIEDKSKVAFINGEAAQHGVQILIEDKIERLLELIRKNRDGSGFLNN